MDPWRKSPMIRRFRQGHGEAAGGASCGCWTSREGFYPWDFSVVF